MSDATSHQLVLTVNAMDGQYQLHGRAGKEDWPDPVYGLFVGEDNWVTVLSGTEWGPITVTLHVHQEKPEKLDDSWDMVAEWPLDCGDGKLTISDTYSDSDPTHVTVVAGWIRLRVSVRNRLDASNQLEPTPEPIEEHRIQMWPVQEQRPPTLLHGPDSLAELLK